MFKSRPRKYGTFRNMFNNLNEPSRSTLGHYWLFIMGDISFSAIRNWQRNPMGATEIKVGQLGISYIVDGSHTESLGMFELTVPPGSNVPPPHSHSNNEECVYVLAGTLRYSVGAETRDLTVGQTMSTPRGEVHAFSNPFAETARALIVLSPDIGAEYFKDVAAVINAGGPPDPAALVSVMSRYGLVHAHRSDA